MVRGDVFELTLPTGRGHVQHGRRFAVVVQSDKTLGTSTTIVCPTSTAVRPTSFRPTITVEGTPTHVLCEQVGAVDASYLKRQAGHLTLDEIRAVDAALEDVLDLGA
ncbi:MAG: type II toxin-antitoxin system PemK/MazF family toxin [Thermoleophilia bacterium]|nr:type II toxin-antitoxin system PemK/MazF family toxin [Thermoleophilia bacterium]